MRAPRLWLFCALASGCAWVPAWAETIRFGDMTPDIPPEFNRKVASDGILMRRDLPPRETPGARAARRASRALP